MDKMQEQAERKKPGAATKDDKGGTAQGKLVGAVSGAVKIMRYLSETTEPVGVSRIARDTKINTSTCFNILKTLAAEDLVIFEPGAKTYSMSLGIMALARGATVLRGDIGAVRPYMQQLATSQRVTVTLWQPISRARKMLVMSEAARSAVRIQMSVGQRLPILIGATGRIFAAFGELTGAEVRKSFDEINWRVAPSFEEFLGQVEKTRELGWARDDGNFASGTVSFAVPILDLEGVAVMAITATMFTEPRSEAEVESIISGLRDVASLISQLINV